jgi:uncharacterized protein (DUF4415 family)
MPKPPQRRPTDARSAAEAFFKPQAPKAPEARPKVPALPGVRELVSLRLDKDVIEHFQAGGPGWQERINAALRACLDKTKD